LPHAVLLDLMQLPPWQQPLKQLRRLQLPPPPEEPEDEPDELPVPPDELLVALVHDPAWQTCMTVVQSLHVEPCMPHAVSEPPELHDPFMSQHPMHVEAQALMALAPSPLALDASSPEDGPLPLSSPPPTLELRPGPVDVGIGAASTAGAASGTTETAGVSRRESSPAGPVPAVAHAARTTKPSQRSPHVFGSDEPMRKTSGHLPSPAL
jgi:hypothetical protein